MSKFRDLVKAEEVRIKDTVATEGWASLAAAYRELDPDVTYAAFRSRILQGKSVVEAGTMPRSRRGRPRKIV